MNNIKSHFNFFKHNFGLIILNAPHRIFNQDRKTINAIIKEYNSFFIRFNSNWDIEQERPFWFVIKDYFGGFEELSSNTRNQIRKGQKNFEIRKTDYKELLEFGYSIYCNSYNIENIDVTEEKFKAGIEEIKDERVFWGIYSDNTLVGYCFVRLIDNTCNYSHIKINKDQIRLYPIYALIYNLNNYYLTTEKVLYINAGAKSLSHETNFQDLLINKFKFRKAYCNLEVQYRKSLKALIFIISPFRFVLKSIPFNIFKKITVLLEQEKIRKECKNHH